VSVASNVSEMVLNLLRDAYNMLTLLRDEPLNETAKANLREIRSWAISIANYVDTILTKAGESDDKR